MIMIKIIKYCICFLTLTFVLGFDDNNIYDKSWALVVGINDYNNIPNLNYAVEDALAIKNMLINEHGFPRKNVRYLIDK